MKAKSSVLPFEQPGAFFHRRAVAKLDRSNYLEAVSFLRRALEREPDNSEYLLDLADVYARMNCFDESNQVLVSILRRGEASPECFFGMGCNFYALRQFPNARDSLLTYQRLEPDGEFVETAEDILDELDDYDEDSLPPELSDLAYKGKRALDAGEYAKAVRLFNRVLSQEPDLLFVRNNLALGYYCLKEMDAAIDQCALVLEEDAYNLHANCNMALFLTETGLPRDAAPFIERLADLEADDPDDLYKLCLTLCELGRDTLALTRLKELLFYRPYDKRALHYYAVAHYNTAQYRKAMNLWDRVRRIDPDNPVAPYCLKLAADAQRTGSAAPLHYYYQLPAAEIRKRLKLFVQLLGGSREEVSARFERDASFRQLIRWGLSVSDEAFQRTTLKLLGYVGGAHAEEILRDFLLFPEGDALKREAMSCLKSMGAQEPFFACLGDSMVEVRVSVFESDHPMTPAQQEVLRIAAEGLPEYLSAGLMTREEVAAQMLSLWVRYLRAAPRPVRVNRPQNWAAALALLFLGQQDIPHDRLEIARRYEVPGHLAEQYHQRMKAALQGAPEEEPRA